jgi:hypothetical protein
MVTCPAPKEEPLGVDKRVDIFVPLTGFRRRGKLYGTRAKAVEYAVSRK